MIVIYRSKHSTQVIVRKYEITPTGVKAAVQRTGRSLEAALKSKNSHFIVLPQPLVSYDIIHEFKDWDEVKLYYPEHFL